MLLGLAVLLPLADRAADAEPADHRQQARTMCLDGEVGSGPKLRRAILMLRSEGERLIGGDLELHGRPMRSIPLQIRAASDGALQATALDSALGLQLTLAAPDQEGVQRGTLHSGQTASELWLRRAEPATGAEWAVGNWRGTAAFARFSVHVSRGPCGLLAGTLDSPDQGQVALPLTSVRATTGGVAFAAKYLGLTIAVARGMDDRRPGEFVQGGVRTDMILERGAWPIETRRRQDPKRPYPYDERAAQYDSRSAGIRLAGTLTVPRGPGPHPALVLISGSGAQDRDELVAGHRPFLVLADFLTRRGYAVLRVDDRGVGGSTGDVLRAGLHDAAADVRAGIDWLRRQPDVDPHRIGILGHSEGAYVAPIVARDAGAGFIILLGGPALKGRDLLLAQRDALAKAAGDPEDARRLARQFLTRVFDVLDSRPADEDLATRVHAVTEGWLASLTGVDRTAAAAMLAARTAAQDEASLSLWQTPWFQSIYHYDPRATLAATHVPVLALYGDLDLQVPSDLNAAALQAALAAAGNRDVTITRLPGVNHMMQRAKTGRIEEYARIEETIAPEVLDAIAAFLDRVPARSR
jgi:pimeloyl-ACP methyl ester carboxylesterase